jgi:N-acetylmuramoyl-L-alanine amidase
MKTRNYPQFVLFIIILTLFSFSSVQSDQFKDKFIVVLDAGHGGKDPGNLGSGFKEKDIALKIVLSVGKELEKNEDIEVIYTRKSDKFLELHERARIANKADADLFVSIHCNSHNSKANGTETFVLGLHANQRNFEIAKKENEVIFLEENYDFHYEGFDPNSPESLIGLKLVQEDYLDQSIQLASFIEDNFNKKLKRNTRGVKQAGFWVLHNTYMPSVLIETGFLTYKKEGLFLNSSKGQKQMSQAITDAILLYKTNLDQNVGENVSLETIEAESEDLVYSEVTFKVQIAASSKKLETKPFNFKGLKDISREKSGSVFKYFYGATSNYTEVQKLKTKAKEMGFNSCFVVAYKNGKRIALANALKTPVN